MKGNNSIHRLSFSPRIHLHVLREKYRKEDLGSSDENQFELMEEKFRRSRHDHPVDINAYWYLDTKQSSNVEYCQSVLDPSNERERDKARDQIEMSFDRSIYMFLDFNFLKFNKFRTTCL